MFGKYYPELKTYSKKICTKNNMIHLHQDLLHEVIHEYLSHEDKRKIERPIEWVKAVMYRSINYSNTSFFRKYITYDKRFIEIQDRDLNDKPLENKASLYQVVSQHLDVHFDFVERVLFQLRLKGFNNREIADMMEISYDTICRINRETQEKLAGKVEFN